MLEIIKNNRKTFLFCGICLSIVAIMSTTNLFRPPIQDSTYIEAISKIKDINSYTQYADTETTESDRKIGVIGLYTLNDITKTYSSYSTTTLSFPKTDGLEQEEHSFTVSNISIKDRIYTKIETTSELLVNSITTTNGWVNFNAHNIPEKYKNIATHGPTIDTLKLFKDDGVYINLLDKKSVEDNKTLYIANLSAEAFSKKGEELLGILTKRLGKNGVIHILINKETCLIESVELRNEPYKSVIEISDINNASLIRPPTDL